MKGADQCPRCASRAWSDADQHITGFYATRVRVCINCGTAWEPFEVTQLVDQDDRYSSLVEPCNNCAFRPGSPEQADRERWPDLMAGLKSGHHFFCHKGVPLDVAQEHGADGFAYPRRPDGTHDVRKLRLCRGHLMMLRARMGREVPA